MPLSPEQAIRLTDADRAQVDAFCAAVDLWLESHGADAVTRIPVSDLSNVPLSWKVQKEVCRRYRAAGWVNTWFENRKFVLWAIRTLSSKQ